MTQYLHAEDPYTPESFIASRESSGVRRSMQRVLSLVDTTDPAWPQIGGVLRELAEAAIGLDESVIPLAIKLGKHRKDKFDVIDPEPSTPEALTASGSIVYYIRSRDLIKIGTTSSPHTRFKDLLPDEILAYEPGARPEEVKRHRQFWHLRETGEYFSDAPDLREHISRIRSVHGEPDPSWPTFAARYEDAARRPARRC